MKISTSRMGKIAHVARRAIIPLGSLFLAGFAGQAVSGVTLRSGNSYVTLDYDVQAWYQSRSYTSATIPGGLNNFYLRRNRIVLSGQFNSVVGFFVDTDAPVDGQQGFNDRSVFYPDAYITIEPNDTFQFLVGKFKEPFARENLEDCFGALTLDRSLLLAYGPFVHSRDTGVALTGFWRAGISMHPAHFAVVATISGHQEERVVPSVAGCCSPEARPNMAVRCKSDSPCRDVPAQLGPVATYTA